MLTFLLDHSKEILLGIAGLTLVVSFALAWAASGHERARQRYNKLIDAFEPPNYVDVIAGFELAEKEIIERQNRKTAKV